MKKYYLNLSVFYYSTGAGFELLTSAETTSYDYSEVKAMIDSLSGDYYEGEFEPDHECIKCSACIITSNGGNLDLDTMIEKYYIFELENLNKDFFKLFNMLELKMK